MAVREVIYSKKFKESTLRDYIAIQGEASRRFGYKGDLTTGFDGSDGEQQYFFSFHSLKNDYDGGYISSVRVRKCGDEETIKGMCDLEIFLKEVDFLPRTL